MLKAIKEFFFGKPNTDKHPLDGPTRAAQEAPYKIEPPSPVAEQATQAVVESIAPSKAKPAKKAKAPAAKTPKALRKPRAPKA